MGQTQIHITNPSNTFSGTVLVSGAGSFGAALRDQYRDRMQFATVNTNPGTASAAFINASGGATIGP